MNSIWMSLNLYRKSLPERYSSEIRRNREEDNARAFLPLVVCCLVISLALVLQHAISPVPYAADSVGTWYMAAYLAMATWATMHLFAPLLLSRLPERAALLIVGGFNFFMLNWTVVLSFIDIKGNQGYDAIVLGAFAFGVLYRATVKLYAAVLSWLLIVGVFALFLFFLDDPGPSRLVPYFYYCIAAFMVSVVLESGRLETAMLRVDLRRTNEELRELSMHDSLTGLYNRYYLNEFLAQQIPFARRQKQCISLLIMDLDKFKEINDRFGHLAGDKVIAQAAQRLRDSVREYDLLFRYGGEEFLVVLLNTKKEDACAVAERIRSSVAADDFHLKDRTVTVSIGISSIPDDGELDDALKVADTRLYAAKAAGRNVCISA